MDANKEPKEVTEWHSKSYSRIWSSINAQI